MNFRIGLGWDRHPLAEGRCCLLGGIVFDEASSGPVGHSDADVVAHAVTDALLGAANLGDLGRHFPDTDERWRGADSMHLLAHAVELIHEAGWYVGNVDLTVITEQPKISPRAAKMSARLANVLQVSASSVSVKATRGEGLGPEGRGECLTVQAIALLTNEEPRS